MVVLTVLLMSAALMLFLAALLDIASGPVAQRRAMASVLGGDEDRGVDRFARLERRFARTRLGRVLERELVLSGSSRSPLVVLLGGLGAGVGTAVLVWQLLAPVLGVLSAGLTVVFIRAYLRRGKDRRREAFIAQMPELARVLANATNAGLSISTAIAIAAQELDEPAHSELTRVSSGLTFGNSLQTALDEVRDRLPSREVAVLLSTLLVSARSGGSLVTSLRTIADTLEDRKETRREIRTTLAQSVATGYTVIGLGVAILILLNVLNPGTVDQMTRNPVGQAALVIAGVLFTVGFLIIRRMTTIKA